MNNTLQHFATKTVKRRFKSKGVSWKNPYKFKKANNDFDIEFNHAIFKNRDSKLKLKSNAKLNYVSSLQVGNEMAPIDKYGDPISIMPQPKQDLRK